MGQNLNCAVCINVLYKWNWTTLKSVQQLVVFWGIWLGCVAGGSQVVNITKHIVCRWAVSLAVFTLVSHHWETWWAAAAWHGLWRPKTWTGLIFRLKFLIWSWNRNKIQNEWGNTVFCPSARFSSQFPNHLQSVQSICGTIFAHSQSNN